MRKTNEIVLFETEDRSITLSVPVEHETVWLNRSQMAELFGRDVKTIGKLLKPPTFALLLTVLPVHK